MHVHSRKRLGRLLWLHGLRRQKSESPEFLASPYAKAEAINIKVFELPDDQVLQAEPVSRSTQTQKSIANGSRRLITSFTLERREENQRTVSHCDVIRHLPKQTGCFSMKANSPHLATSALADEVLCFQGQLLMHRRQTRSGGDNIVAESL